MHHYFCAWITGLKTRFRAFVWVAAGLLLRTLIGVALSLRIPSIASNTNDVVAVLEIISYDFLATLVGRIFRARKILSMSTIQHFWDLNHAGRAGLMAKFLAQILVTAG